VGPPPARRTGRWGPFSARRRRRRHSFACWLIFASERHAAARAFGGDRPVRGRAAAPPPTRRQLADQPSRTICSPTRRQRDLLTDAAPKTICSPTRPQHASVMPSKRSPNRCGVSTRIRPYVRSVTTHLLRSQVCATRSQVCATRNLALSAARCELADTISGSSSRQAGAENRNGSAYRCTRLRGSVERGLSRSCE
jgi:hypothetical protein